MRAQLLRLIAVMVACLALPMLVSGCGPGTGFEEGVKRFARVGEEKVAVKSARHVAKEAPTKVTRVRATKEAAGVTAKEEAARLAAGLPLGRGHTGRWKPNNALEKLAMDRVIDNPAAGRTLPIVLGDPLWSSKDGWVKKQQIVFGVNIHYNFNERMGGAIDDAKFTK